MEIRRVVVPETLFAPTRMRRGDGAGGQRHRRRRFSADRIVPDIWRAARSGQELVLRNPQATRPWQHVLDCLDGYFLYAEALAGGDVPLALNFGPEAGVAMPVADIAAAPMPAIRPGPDWIVAADPGPREMAKLALDTRLAREHLDWRDQLAGDGLSTGPRHGTRRVLRAKNGARQPRTDRGIRRLGRRTESMNSEHKNCRFCQAPLTETFADLGATPLSNSYVTQADIAAGHDSSYPLHARVCGTCFLVQADEVVSHADIFGESYMYFSSYATTWVAHAKRYDEAMTARFGLGAQSRVVEVASNDGYLLQHFVAAGFPCSASSRRPERRRPRIAKGISTRIDYLW